MLVMYPRSLYVQTRRLHSTVPSEEREGGADDVAYSSR